MGTEISTTLTVFVRFRYLEKLIKMRGLVGYFSWNFLPLFEDS